MPYDIKILVFAAQQIFMRDKRAMAFTKNIFTTLKAIKYYSLGLFTLLGLFKVLNVPLKYEDESRKFDRKPIPIQTRSHMTQEWTCKCGLAWL